jgi:solute carrier family 23 (nucleobase transporter), member 1
MTAKSTNHIIYGVDERPPLGRSVVYAFQHIFAMILGSITGGVIIGETVGLSSEQTGQLIGYINLAVGIATILQVKLGVKLPIIQGSTMGHVPAYLALGSIGVSLYSDPTLTMQYLGGALLIGAALEALFGYFNGMRLITRFVSPITIGIVVMMVGLGLWPVINDFIGASWPYAFGVIILVFIGSFAFGKGVKTMALFLAVVVAYAVAILGTYLDWFSKGDALFVDFNPINNASWVTLPSLFPWGPPKFNPGFILAMTIPYIATALESFGDYLAVAESSGQETPNIKRISRGIGTEGVASIISSALGGTSSSFSQNVGVVRLSGVASKYVCVVAGVLLIFMGLIGKFGVVLGQIPRVILGSVYLTVFGILVMTGLRLVLKAQVTTSRNEMIIGTSLLLGLALPAYMKENPVEFESTSLQIFSNVFLATPMMVSGLWAFVFDNILPGTDEERGIKKWL